MLKKVVFYMVLAFLLLPMVIAYKVNLDCSPDDAATFDVTVEPGSTVSCQFVLDEALGNIGTHFYLYTSGLLGTFTPVEGYFLSESLRGDGSYDLAITDSDTDPPGSFPFTLATVNLGTPAVGSYDLYLDLPSDDGFGDPTTGGFQDCSDMSFCTNAHQLSPVKVVVERGFVDSEPDGVNDLSEPAACVGVGSVGNVYTSRTIAGCLYGDVNGDGCITIEDVAILAEITEVNYVTECASPAPDSALVADMNGDQCITIEDVAILAEVIETNYVAECTR